MDTRFWGPSGWRLLHLITFQYEPSQRDSVKEMFQMLEYVLPCKYCRASFSEYIEKLPIEPHLTSKTRLSRWLYKIHNMVNEKLRKQNLLHEPNPSFASVKKVYEERIQEGCMRTAFEGWDFLFSIAENHPFSPSSKVSSPMENTPSDKKEANTPELRNRYNIITPEERITFYKRFWRSIGPSLPFTEWRDAWSECKPIFENNYKKELWKLRCCMEKKLELVNQEKFESVCKKLEEHKSGCNKKKRGKTCRRSQKKKKKYTYKK